MNAKAWATSLVFVATAALCAPVAADVLVLKSGQTFEGKVLEANGKVNIVLPYATVSFEKDEVSSIEYGPTPLEIYKERAAAIPQGDAAAHYELGLYCEQKKLLAQARSEYEKAVAADGDHEGARAKLGFVRVDGKWLAYDEYMKSQGYVLYKGRYVTKERAAELEKSDASAAGEREARNLVRTLVYLVGVSDATRSRQAQERLSGMSDPAALVPLIEVLADPSPAVRTAALLAMPNYREDEAALATLDVALYDDVDDIRRQAKTILNRKQSPAALAAAVEALATDDDTVRFRASQALGAIGDPAAVPYLIDYLSWRRPAETAPSAERPRRKVPPRYVAGVRAKVAPGVVAYEPIMGGFDSSGRRVILNDDQGDERPVTQWTDEVVLNYDALAALKAMTGQDFRFDADAWRTWWSYNGRRFERPGPTAPAGAQAAPPAARE